MATSGEYQSTRDEDVECDCDFAGRIEVIYDAADRTIWWTCPDCASLHNRSFGDDLDD